MKKVRDQKLFWNGIWILISCLFAIKNNFVWIVKVELNGGKVGSRAKSYLWGEDFNKHGGEWFLVW